MSSKHDGPIYPEPTTGPLADDHSQYGKHAVFNGPRDKNDWIIAVVCAVGFVLFFGTAIVYFVLRGL